MEILSWRGFKIEVRRRPRQRTLSLRVPAPGVLRVSCSKGVPVKSVLAFIEEKKSFIEERENEWRLLLENASVRRFEAGESCPFLGTPRRLEFLFQEGREKAELDGERVVLRMNQYERSRAQELLISFYRKAGRNYLNHLLRVQSARMGLYPTAVSFRSQRTRWGSCSSEGKVSLNWRLVAAHSEIAEYVVIHELAHLSHQDHSPRFWSLVERFCPEFRRHKRWLKDHQIQFEFLDARYLDLF